MVRSVNPNSPEEVRRGIQLANGKSNVLQAAIDNINSEIEIINGEISTLQSGQISGLHPGRVALSKTATSIDDNANLTFDGTYLTSSSIKDSALTSGRMTYAGSSGLLQDSGNLTFTGTTLSTVNLNLPSTTDSTHGIFYKNSIVFIHTYSDPTSQGGNFFMGSDAGNFTMGPSGGASILGSLNTGIGANVLSQLTTGHENMAIGAGSCFSVTTGAGNLAMGGNSLYHDTSGSFNIAIGANALVWIDTGSYNTAIGQAAFAGATSANNNVAIGNDAGGYATGSACVYIGVNSGYNASNASGSSPPWGSVPSGNLNVAVGYDSGYSCVGSNNVFIGSYSGYYETGSNSLMIDGLNRGVSQADSRLKSMVYGVFASTTSVQTFTVNARMGVNVAPSASAWLTLSASPGNTGPVPLLITPGTLLATPVSGAIESDGAHLYWTDSSGARHTIV